MSDWKPEVYREYLYCLQVRPGHLPAERISDLLSKGLLAAETFAEKADIIRAAGEAAFPEDFQDIFLVALVDIAKDKG